MVKALSARVFIRVFEVCRSLVLIPPNGLPCKKVAEMAAIRIHVPSKLSFYLWLELCPSRESAVAPFPRLLCRKALATVVGTRCESAVPRKG
uniref:Uncharacterized protein n=1 Tax=Fagus sylvatica TaxID=28930 RepID=A0A2N9FVS5_FAGSY